MDTPGLLNPPCLAIVVPCYNEAEALPLSSSVLLGILDSLTVVHEIAPDSFILCVDDGSQDDTWRIISGLHESDPRIKGISLAHNSGHQFALLAGLDEVIDKCDCAVSIDADLQDDPQVIGKMVAEYRRGKEIVYGVRKSRKSDSFFKRFTAHVFYSFQKLMGLDTVYDHADYRLMSRRALEILSRYSETNIFLRGIVPLIGLETAKVYYDRTPRIAGESKYPFSKMLALSVDGITSFSVKPMQWIFYLGLAILFLTLVVSLYVLVSYFGRNDTVPGWTSLMLSVWFLGSLILIAIGIVGEYVGKIFMEVKRRPRYAVSSRIS